MLSYELFNREEALGGAEAEVRLDYPEGEPALRAVAGEVPAFSSLRSATFRLTAGYARKLKA
jgi:hypothetical protein